MNKIINVFKKTGASKQLVMFPFGGGNGFSFLELVHRIASSDIEVFLVNPPGHLFCEREPLESIVEMVQLYATELRPLLNGKEILFFGHSLGGIVAYEVCRILEKEKNINHLLISAVNPPHCILDTVDIKSCMDDNQLLAECDQLGGIRGGGLMDDPEFLKKFAAALRADLKALENYVPEPGSESLTTPGTILYGSEDVMKYEKLQEWNRYLEPQKFIEFPGDHFYLFSKINREKVCRILLENLGLPTAKKP